MLTMSGFGVVAAVLSIGLAVACYLVAAAYARVAVHGTAVAPAGAHAGAHGGHAGGRASHAGAALPEPGPAARVLAGGLAGPLGGYGTTVAWLGLLFLTLALVTRTIASGHAPFANMYEFSLAFSWGIVGMSLYFETHYRERTLGLVALPIALALLLYALTLPSRAAPLVPALQNSLLLTVHVATAIVAYGMGAVAFAASVLRLVRPDPEGRTHEKLDEIAYRSVIVGFPFLTLTIALGAVWAEIAWASYWNWDPKETASLVTWLIYGAYLHARVVRGWRGDRAAWLLVAGFIAIVFTFFGNLFLGGAHAYAGV